VSIRSTADAHLGFADGPNAAYPRVITLTTTEDSASSLAQSLSMNVTALPEGGATYRVHKTTANGGGYLANAWPLEVGLNTVAVTAAGFPRAVKIRFSSEAIEFDSLSVNDSVLYPEPAA